MRLDVARVTGIEFVIDESVEQDFGIRRRSRRRLLRHVPCRAQHRTRAGQPRLTVPTGTPATWAIS